MRDLESFSWKKNAGGLYSGQGDGMKEQKHIISMEDSLLL